MNYCQFRNDFIKRMANSAKPLLPPEYQQVEYIETAAANTSILSGVTTVNHNSSFELEYMVTAYVSGGNILAARSSNDVGIYFGTYQNGYYQFGNNASGGKITAIPLNTKCRHKTNKNIIYRYDYNTNSYIQERAAPTSVFSFVGELPIFCGNWGNTDANRWYIPGRLYYFKFWQSDILACDLIPCYRKSDNVAGVYNIVTNTFITARTGSFIAGQDV